MILIFIETKPLNGIEKMSRCKYFVHPQTAGLGVARSHQGDKNG